MAKKVMTPPDGLDVNEKLFYVDSTANAGKIIGPVVQQVVKSERENYKAFMQNLPPNHKGNHFFKVYQVTRIE